LYIKPFVHVIAYFIKVVTPLQEKSYLETILATKWNGC